MLKLQFPIPHANNDLTNRKGGAYFFVDHSEFDRMINQSLFIEHTRIFDHYYGTSIKTIETLILQGKHVILDINWQSARKVRKKYPEAVSVFVIPKPRLDNEEINASRMRDVTGEMNHIDEFDITIINDNFDKTADQLENILANTRIR